MMRRFYGVLGVWVLASAALLAADFWEDKDFTTWSDKQVEKMLTDSPWSRKVSIRIPNTLLARRVGGLSGGRVGSGGGVGRAGGGGGAGGAGAGNLGGGGFMPPPRRTQFPLRWLSALPVKQAMVREGVAGAAPIPADAQPLLEQDEPYYRVAVVGLPRAFGQALGGLDEVREATILKRKNKEPVAPIDIRLAYAGDLLSIEFHFPRTDAITLDDKEVEFITRLGQAKLSKKFKLKDMIFGSPKVHVGHFASLTLGGGSSMLVSQSMIPPMSADAEWRQSLRIRPPAFRL